MRTRSSSTVHSPARSRPAMPACRSGARSNSLGVAGPDRVVPGEALAAVGPLDDGRGCVAGHEPVEVSPVVGVDLPLHDVVGRSGRTASRPAGDKRGQGLLPDRLRSSRCAQVAPKLVDRQPLAEGVELQGEGRGRLLETEAINALKKRVPRVSVHVPHLRPDLRRCGDGVEADAEQAGVPPREVAERRDAHLYEVVGGVVGEGDPTHERASTAKARIPSAAISASFPP